jgi:hypothetical protein
VPKAARICMISTSGLGKIQVKMKLGLRPSRQLNLMPSLEVVQSNIGNSKVMNLTNSCHTSSLALYLWRVVSPLGSKSLKRRSLKHGCIFAEGRELYELKRYGRFTCCMSFSIFCSIILDAALLVQVPFARSSLNHDDVFVLDTENKIYQFNGANSNIQERAKALEVIQYLKEKYHGGVCDVAIVDDGKLQAESDSGEFWVLFGGFAPIGKKLVSDDDVVLETTAPKLYSINDGQLKLEEAALTKAMLENTKCFLLDCGAEIYVWVGRVTQMEDRKSATKAVEEFLINQKRPKTTRVTQVIQGYESHAFKSKFESWPVGNAAGSPGVEEGRGKVAALLKQKGVDVKGAAKNTAPVNEEVPPLLEGGGKLEVWCVDGNAKTALPKEDIGKFYSGDCYIILYAYNSGDKKEEYYLSYWIGKDSLADDQAMASQLANTMWNSLKGRPVLGRIYQGKEPPQFVALFQPMVILKGGIGSGYKKLVEEKGVTGETYSSEGIALFRVSGTSIHNNKILQVDAVLPTSFY